MSTVCNWEGESIHIERTKPNSLNYAYFRDKVICFEYLDIFPGNFIQVGGFFFNFVNFLWLYMSIYLFYSSRMYLILQGHINKALQRWYWMTELPKYGRVQIDSYIKSLWLKSRRKKMYKVWTKLDKTVEFFANHMHLIMGNCLMKSIFVTLWKKMWLMGIYPTFLHKFGDSSIKDWCMVTLVI